MPVIDYSKYPREDLESALASIDREKFPENYAALLEALRKWDADPEASAARFAPPPGFFIKKNDERITEKAKPTGEYHRVEGADGAIRFDHDRSILPAALAGIMGAAFLIYVHRAGQGSMLLPTVMVSAFFLVCFHISFSWRRLTLGPDTLEIGSGFAVWVRSETFRKEELRLVRFERHEDGEGTSYRLCLATQRENRLWFDADRNTLLWLGSEIATWAGVPYYRRHI